MKMHNSFVKRFQVGLGVDVDQLGLAGRKEERLLRFGRGIVASELVHGPQHVVDLGGRAPDLEAGFGVPRQVAALDGSHRLGVDIDPFGDLQSGDELGGRPEPSGERMADGAGAGAGAPDRDHLVIGVAGEADERVVRRLQRHP